MEREQLAAAGASFAATELLDEAAAKCLTCILDELA